MHKVQQNITYVDQSHPILLPIQHSSGISSCSHATTQQQVARKKMFSISNVNSDFFFCPVSDPISGWYVGVCVLAVDCEV